MISSSAIIAHPLLAIALIVLPGVTWLLLWRQLDHQADRHRAIASSATDAIVRSLTQSRGC
jgi:hypothetical protein